MNKVIVHVVGLQTDEFGVENRIELTSVGKHCCKNGINYVLYEDGEITGMEGTSTLLKIAGDCVTLVRRGGVAQEQRFVRSERTASRYATPYGKLALSVLTNKLEIEYGAISGSVAIEYELTVNGRWQSDNRLHIQVAADRAESGRLN